MNRDELLNTLKTLHTQLSGAGDIDAETQKMLQTVTSDIQNLLKAGSAGQGADESGKSLSDRLRDTLIEFEARHPHVGGLLERITDGLASMGI